MTNKEADKLALRVEQYRALEYNLKNWKLNLTNIQKPMIVDGGYIKLNPEVEYGPVTSVYAPDLVHSIKKLVKEYIEATITELQRQIDEL